MRRNIFAAALWLVMLLAAAGQSFAGQAQWERVCPGITDVTNCVALENDPGVFLVSNARGEVYRWQSQPDGTPDRADRRLKRVFSLKNSPGPLSLFSLRNVVFLVDADSLYSSRDQGFHWRRLSTASFPGRIVSAFEQKERGLSFYALSNSGLYSSYDNGVSWKKVFALAAPESGPTDSEEAYAEERQEAEQFSVACAAVSPRDPANIWLTDGRKIMGTRDGGRNWSLEPCYGLFDTGIRDLEVYAGRLLFAATANAVFYNRDGRWYELSQRLAAGEVRSIFIEDGSKLYAACEQGLYRLSVDLCSPQNPEMNISSPASAGIPTIRQVQEAAVEYADANDRKIRDWRKKAAARAWIPELSIGINQDTADLWHWEGGSTTRECDDILRKGKRTTEWDISLQWELADLIWSSEQTSIDVRSRLLVQLRQDVLDEVTRLYFERVRLVSELDALTITEKAKIGEKQLRIAEITALLDGMTGGFFSSHNAGSSGG